MEIQVLPGKEQKSERTMYLQGEQFDFSPVWACVAFKTSFDKRLAQALTKFLKCVTWTDPTEAKQAVDLLSAWVDIDVDDALELLGAAFVNRSVRTYAVKQLGRADDDVRL